MGCTGLMNNECPRRMRKKRKNTALRAQEMWLNKSFWWRPTPRWGAPKRWENGWDTKQRKARRDGRTISYTLLTEAMPMPLTAKYSSSPSGGNVSHRPRLERELISGDPLMLTFHFFLHVHIRPLFRDRAGPRHPANTASMYRRVGGHGFSHNIIWGNLQGSSRRPVMIPVQDTLFKGSRHNERSPHTEYQP